MQSGIRRSGRVGSAIVPNWRWEDDRLDPYELRIAGWLASHSDGWREDHVTRNMIATRTGISAGKVSAAIDTLTTEGIISVETIEISQSQGGKRWVVTIHLDVWQDPTDPRSCGDQGPGHVVTTPGHVVTATTGIPVEETKQRESELSVHDATIDQLCKLFSEYLTSNDVKHTITKRWWSDMDRLVRLDDRTPEQISAVIRWLMAARSDVAQFWGPNIESPSSLRAKWDKMRRQHEREAAPRQTLPKGAAPGGTIDRMMQAQREKSTR